MARGEDTQDPHPVDRHVGRRVQEKRLGLGLSQTALGKAVGVSFQQMQKYEKGQNRISASKLFEIADFLNVGIPYFFDGYSSRPGLRACASWSLCGLSSSAAMAGDSVSDTNSEMTEADAMTTANWR